MCLTIRGTRTHSIPPAAATGEKWTNNEAWKEQNREDRLSETVSVCGNFVKDADEKGVATRWREKIYANASDDDDDEQHGT